MKKYVLILAAIIVFGACQRNKLKTDEKALTKQILIEEE